MRVELLYFDGCPSHERFLPRLKELVGQSGVRAEVEQRRVESPKAAVAARFLGSPSVRVDGKDIEPEAEKRCDYGLKCRLYQTPTGLHGTPPDEWVVEALEAARNGDSGQGRRAG